MLNLLANIMQVKLYCVGCGLICFDLRLFALFLTSCRNVAATLCMTN